MANLSNIITDANGNVTQVTNAMVGGRNKKAILANKDYVPSDLYIAPDKLGDNGMPVEYGNSIKPTAKSKTYEEIMADRFKILDDFQDKTKGFVFGVTPEPVNYFTADSNGRMVDVDLTKISLGSFVSTLDDNEDPTILGFDIIIKETTSPLFNGAIEDFINHPSNSDNTEIQSRAKILAEFKQVFFRYFKSEINDNAKVHYLKRLSGLDKLHESVTNTTSSKAFVSYGEDVICLSLGEDVTQNMGYLASLYKMLSWSRINGKLVIPPNLLRFEAEIVITDVRNFNRIVKNDVGSLTSLADNISKYIYTLYDCQFMFTMPHGSDMDITNKTPIETFDITFDYKFSTMKFERYTYDKNSIPGQRKMIVDVINNGNVDVTMYGPADTNNSSVNVTGAIEHNAPSKKYNEKQQYVDPFAAPKKVVANNDVIGGLKESTRTDIEASLNKLGTELMKASEEAANRAIVERFKLVNKTFNNIRDQIPYAGRMSEPTNVYHGTQSPSFENDAINAARDFVGSSLKSLFDKK